MSRHRRKRCRRRRIALRKKRRQEHAAMVAGELALEKTMHALRSQAS